MEEAEVDEVPEVDVATVDDHGTCHRRCGVDDLPPIMNGFLRNRFAITPPQSENTKDRSMNDGLTEVRAKGELVMS